jgi:hypothetical protein
MGGRHIMVCTLNKAGLDIRLELGLEEAALIRFELGDLSQVTTAKAVLISLVHKIELISLGIRTVSITSRSAWVSG